MGKRKSDSSTSSEDSSVREARRRVRKAEQEKRKAKKRDRIPDSSDSDAGSKDAAASKRSKKAKERQSLEAVLASPKKPASGSKKARRQTLHSAVIDDVPVTKTLRANLREAIASAGPDVPKNLNTPSAQARRVEELKARAATAERAAGALLSGCAAILAEADKHPEAARVLKDVLSSKAVRAGITGADNAAPVTPAEVQEEMKFKRVCARCGYNNHTAEDCVSARHSSGKALAGGREAL